MSRKNMYQRVKSCNVLFTHSSSPSTRASVSGEPVVEIIVADTMKRNETINVSKKCMRWFLFTSVSLRSAPSVRKSDRR